MLRLNVDDLKQEIAHFDVFRTAGRLRSAQGIVRARLRTAVGDMCHILRSDGRTVPGEVIGFDGATAQIMPYETTDGLEPDATVVGMGRKLRIPVGRELLGRIINALGRPIDGGHLRARQWSTIQTGTPSPLERPPIETPFVTGQRVIDGLLTLGKGQRVGLFAGSGVGKSTLLGEIAKSASSDLNVIALVGERGREVRPFLEECLGPEGLARSVVIVSTADQPPLLRIRATQTAVTIADHFRSHGADVLLLVDSLTRLAMAQREIGLLMGEPPSARGYTPSVFQMLSNVLEQLGTSAHGSITGICTVLVDGDDMDEPVADNVRAVVDGHIVLSRRLAERGHYPAVDVGASVSRTFREVTDPQHQSAARKVRAALSTYNDVADVIRVGAYTPGTSKQVDRAIELLPAIELFLRQDVNLPCPWNDTQRAITQLAAAWPF